MECQGKGVFATHERIIRHAVPSGSFKYIKHCWYHSFTITWKTKDGWLDMNASDFITLYNEFQTFLQGLYQKEKALQEQVEAAPTIEEWESIKW